MITLSDEYKARHNEILDQYIRAQEELDQQFEILLAEAAQAEKDRLLPTLAPKFKVGDRVTGEMGQYRVCAGTVTDVRVRITAGDNDDYYAERYGPGQFVHIDDDDPWRQDVFVTYQVQPDPSPVRKFKRDEVSCYEHQLRLLT